jgi:DNA-binding LacI/PurR family transcriptional regulator
MSAFAKKMIDKVQFIQYLLKRTFARTCHSELVIYSMSRVTLKQVASRAGVSYQTVSKVINSQATVSKETEERVWETIRSLGYRPNWIARGLRSRRSLLIGYSWEPSPLDQANPILDQFLQSMAKAAESAGYHLLAFPHHTGKRWIDAYRELIDTNRVDGFVLSSVEYDDPRIQFLHERKFPFVAFGRSNPGWDFPFVDVDGAAGMRMVVEHLVSQGNKRIAALAWPEASRVGQNRMEGFLDALHDSGISPPPEWILRGEGVYSFGRLATRQLLDRDAGNRPTAIVAFNDIMAIGAMHAATEKGLKSAATSRLRLR